MKKLLSALIIVGVVAAIGGGVLLAVGLTNGKDNGEYITNEYELTDSFDSIKGTLIDSKIEIKKSEDGKNKVVTVDKDFCYHDVKVAEGTLNITQIDTRQWYEKIFSFGFIKTPEAIVYLTENSLKSFVSNCKVGSIKIDAGFTFNTITCESDTGAIWINCDVKDNLKVNSDTGAVYVSNCTVKDVSIKNHTGSIKFENVTSTSDINAEASTGSIRINGSTCENLKAKCSTGSVYVSESIANQNMDIKTSTGSIKLDRVDTATATLRATTGSIVASFLTPKIFQTHSDTGSVKCPASTEGGLVTAETDTGSIILSIV